MIFKYRKRYIIIPIALMFKMSYDISPVSQFCRHKVTFQKILKKNKSFAHKALKHISVNKNLITSSAIQN